jgi:acyl-CoA synthetase (AMP-forming)/AMP-acid ligase II
MATTQALAADHRSIAHLLRDRAVDYANRIAVREGDRETSFHDLHEQARCMARALIAAGIEPGDFVVCWAPNVTRWVVAAHAAWMAGAVLMPLSTRLKAREVGPLLEATGAKLLITVGECAGTRLIEIIKAAYGEGDGRPFDRLPAVRCILRLDQDRSAAPGEVGFVDFLASSEAVSDADLDAVIAGINGEMLAEVMFTSGSTGAPKGVQLNHDQLMRAYRDWADVAALRAGDVYLVIPPFSHGFGLNAGILASAERGMTMVLMDIFDPARALDLILRHGITVASGPPNLYLSLLDQRARTGAEVTTLRVCFIGAASVPMELLRRVRAELGVSRAINAYGLIEGCVVSMTRADDPEDVISTTTGRPMDGVEIRIVDDENQPVSQGQTGEIVMRGYNVMQGYWREPALTDAAIDAGGWLHSGDIGLLESHGCIRIVDRKKDMFTCGGFNVYPAEVENLLLSSGLMSAVSVVGVGDRRMGEVGVAFVIPHPGSAVTTDQLTAWARENMANYKVPRTFVLGTELPLNANGKVAKDVLRTSARQYSDAGEA